jgi:inhibitor of KinA sporulation pathway (predicted exonuclease)
VTQKNKKKTLLVVDFEATSIQDNQNRPGSRTEIIEVGICPLNLESLTCVSPESFLITPQRSGIGPFIEELTGITQIQVNQRGMKWSEFCQHMRIGRPQLQDMVWGSWGSWDRRVLDDNCKMNNCLSPFGNNHLDLKRLYWLVRFPDRHPMGLSRALREEGLKFRGKQHTAGDDAFNTARLMCFLMRRLISGYNTVNWASEVGSGKE